MTVVLAFVVTTLPPVSVLATQAGSEGLVREAEALWTSGAPGDYRKARRVLARLAEEGDAEAHAMLGIAHASGLGMPNGVDAARALLHLYFAASGGDVSASMALAHDNLVVESAG